MQNSTPVKGIRYESVPSPSLVNRRCVAVAVVLLIIAAIGIIVGALCLAGVGSFSNVGKVGGVVILVASALLPLGTYFTKREYTVVTTAIGERKESQLATCPIPTYDTLVANNPQLAELVKGKNPTVTVVYKFQSSTRSDPEDTIYRGIQLETRKLLFTTLRDTYEKYASEGDFQFAVKITFSKGKEKLPFTWSNVANPPELISVWREN